MNNDQNQVFEGTISGSRIVNNHLSIDSHWSPVSGAAPVYPIKGARVLPQHEIDLINRIKAKGAELEALIEEVRAAHIREVATFNYADATQEQRTAFNAHVGQGQHWRMRAVDSLQDGLMQLTRSVARPTTFA